jgi:hypothetical protein
MEFRIGDRVKYIGDNTPDGYMRKGDIYPVVDYNNGNRSYSYIVNVSKHGGMDRRYPHNMELELVNTMKCKSNCPNCNGKCDFWEEE